MRLKTKSKEGARSLPIDFRVTIADLFVGNWGRLKQLLLEEHAF